MKAFLRAALALCLAASLLPLAACAQELRGYDAKEGYQYVALGSWPQGANGEVEPILWRVLGITDQEALLLSEYVLGNRRVHPDGRAYEASGGVWTMTDMYTFLNQTFLPQAFTDEEKQLLLTSQDPGTVFLPSGEDLYNKAYGFKSNKSRMAKGTAYALANGLFKYSTKYSPYWTRSQSSTKHFGARCTKVSGALGYIRVVVENLGWRPACRLDLGNMQIVSGDGTMASPYVLSPLKRP